MEPDFNKERAGSVSELRMALEAIKAHRDAEMGGAPREEIQRLRVLADSLHRALIDYRLLCGEHAESPH